MEHATPLACHFALRLCLLFQPIRGEYEVSPTRADPFVCRKLEPTSAGLGSCGWRGGEAGVKVHAFMRRSSATATSFSARALR
jgi:hypothetical protein